MEWPDRVVVRIEKLFITSIERPIAGQKRLQKKGFEEPRDVREVPLGRARIDDALDLVVVGLEGHAQRFSAVPDFRIPGVGLGQRQ
jgi:hypothetical protein